jgi:hypothetical protein
MPISYVYYDLQDGFINNCLVGGRQIISLKDLERFVGGDFEH